jgi:hypothetical protein
LAVGVMASSAISGKNYNGAVSPPSASAMANSKPQLPTVSVSSGQPAFAEAM